MFLFNLNPARKEVIFVLELSVDLNLRLAPRLTLEQRVLVLQHTLSLRLELVAAIRAEQWKSNARCPQCNRRLTLLEILKGFNQDPGDVTTGCPKCNRRFRPFLICQGDGWAAEIPFYCPSQVLEMLKGEEGLSPAQLSKKYSAIYRSTLIHFGTLGNAFAKIGITYIFKEVDAWKQKARPFLGRLPDGVIAECVGRSARTIGTERRRLRIPRYSKSQSLEELEESGEDEAA